MGEAGHEHRSVGLSSPWLSSPVWCCTACFHECSWSALTALLISIFGMEEASATRRLCSFPSPALVDLPSLPFIALFTNAASGHQGLRDHLTETQDLDVETDAPKRNKQSKVMYKSALPHNKLPPPPTRWLKTAMTSCCSSQFCGRTG